MAVLRRLEKLLDENHIRYTHHVHPTVYTAREVASAERVPERRIAKTVVYCGNEGYGVVVLPADSMVDLQELRVALGLDRVRLATEKELSELFPDCDLGAMPPFGHLYDLPTFLASSLAGVETITFDAGTHRDAINLRLEDYRRLAKPIVIRFSRPGVH